MRLLSFAITVAVGVATGSFCDEADFALIWSDEFDGDAVNASTWTVAAHGPGRSDTRDAAAIASAVAVANGALVITTNGTWDASTAAWTNLTSGAVQSKGKRSFEAGGVPLRVCISAKLPGGGAAGAGRGVWPALWLMPDTSACWPCAGEIDILEMINGDGLCRGTYHWNKSNKSGDNQESGSSTPMPAGWGDAWHEFGVEYDGATAIKFALDGKVYDTVTKWTWSSHLQRARFFDVPYYFILNTAVGGGWPEPPDAGTVMPTQHYVDYVRVARKKSAAT